MKLTYDPRHNIAYLRFAEAPSDEVESVRLGDQLNVDLAPDGTVYGIELLNANEQVHALTAGRFIIENEATGETLDVVLP